MNMFAHDRDPPEVDGLAALIASALALVEARRMRPPRAESRPWFVFFVLCTLTFSILAVHGLLHAPDKG